MRHKHHYPNCLNCRHELAEHYNFCPNCGQHPTDGKISFGHLFLEFFEDLVHLDGKLIATLRHVFIPGKLTEEFFKGRHKSYAAPLQLFLVLGGLFFVLISVKTHKSEEKLQAQFDKRKTGFLMKQVLMTTDSINKTFDIYKNQSSVKTFADSVVKKTYYYYNPKGGNGKEEDYSASLRKLKNIRNRRSFNIGSTNQDSLRKKYEADSIQFIEQIADDKDISKEAAEKIAPEISDSIAEANGQQFFEVAGFNSDDKNFLKKDSLHLFSGLLKKTGKGSAISEADIYNLKEEEILEKYQVEGYWQRLVVRQTMRFYKSGGNLLHYLLSKSLWFILASMLPIAFFLKLLYFRRHKFLIEHFLFLMHFFCFFFIVSIIYLGLPMLLERFMGASVYDSKYTTISSLFTTIYYLSILIGLWIAMKQFYKQGWLKTSLKYFILVNAAVVIGSIVATFGLVIGLAMF